MWKDVKMRRCEDVMIRCDDRPPLLEGPFAQTLSGKNIKENTCPYLWGFQYFYVFSHGCSQMFNFPWIYHVFLTNEWLPHLWFNSRLPFTGHPAWAARTGEGGAKGGRAKGGGAQGGGAKGGGQGKAGAKLGPMDFRGEKLQRKGDLDRKKRSKDMSFYFHNECMLGLWTRKKN